MNRQAWIFVGAIGGLTVLTFTGAAIVTLLFGSGDDGAAASRCRDVSPAMLAAIEEGLEPGLSLSDAAAVRSDDYERVYFIAAEIDGPGMDGGDEVGIWASTRLEPGKGLIYAVDGIAREFSDWGDGPGLSITDDGAREARECG